MSVIDEIKARVDIVDLVSETVKLRRSGKNYTGFCPFHENKRTPAFAVFADTGTWRCFGQCNEGGDIFRYVMKREGWDFNEALKYLANRAGVQLTPSYAEEKERGEEYQRLRTLLEDAVTFYRHQLFQTPPGLAALDYLHKRGIQDAAIENFGLGYAPHAWEATLQYFTGRGYTPDELLQVGLATAREGGGIYDRFRHRITFPIRDPAGKMAGFGARILDPNDVPKFLNSPQTVLFDKGGLLYGLDLARKPIRAQDQVVLVEGYLDVIALHQGGFANSVSPMGTALTETQLRLLKRFTRRIVLALDADAAGEKATLRGLEVARQALDHSQELAFDPRGLLRQEARLQADLRVTTLPQGVDPDEIVNRDPEEWKRILTDAKPIVVHVMDTLSAGRDLEDAKVKSAIAAQVLPLIGDVPDPVERDAYRQRLARLLKVDERALQGNQPAAARPRRSRREEAAESAAQGKPSAPAGRGAQILENYCLGVLVEHPETLNLLDRALQQAGLGRFSLQDFDHSDHQVILRLVQQSLEQDDLEPQQYVQANLPETLQDLLSEMLHSAPEAGSAERRLEELVRAVMRLRRSRLNESLNQLRYLQEELQQQGDPYATPYQELVMQHTRAREALDRALRQK